MKSRGFTMIEVMIVIVIIGILAALGAGAYTQSMSRGRDAKRISDMQQIQKGFEQYYAVNNQYDPGCDLMFNDTSIFPSRMPVDPKGDNYVGSNGCTPAIYCICAEMENPDNYGNSNENDCSNFSATKPTKFFCVQNLQ